jgi:hypothetical protein
VFSSFTFDTVLQFGTTGFSSGLNKTISFDMTKSGLSTALFSNVGLRIQTVGTSTSGGDGSLKIYNDDPSVVPLPGSRLAAARGRRRPRRDAAPGEGGLSLYDH